MNNPHVKRLAIVSMLSVMFVSKVGAVQPSIEIQLQEARSMVKSMASSLKSVLKPALTSGGPVTAIEICKINAPDISAKLSTGSPWNIRRTSLKLRNPNNAPDAWEARVLAKFEQQKQQGAAVKKLEFSQVVTTNGEQYLRYMKAIPTAKKPCLACHGQSISKKVSQKLAQSYPNDKAVGYQVGDIRGAFTLIKKL